MTARELLTHTLQQSGYPDYEKLVSDGPVDCTKSFKTMHFLNGFGHPDGRFRFQPAWSELGEQGREMPTLPGHWDVKELPDSTHPFRLVTAPARNFLNSTFSETARSVGAEKQPHLKIHPVDAAELGVETGAQVQVGNARGEVSLIAELFDGLQRGVVISEGIWPGSAFPGGRGINVLVGADSIAPAGGAAFHDVTVWVRTAAN
jgi:anaerobic selenocysteine-containing dehydrogenase